PRCRHPPPPHTYTPSLHDALPISAAPSASTNPLSCVRRIQTPPPSLARDTHGRVHDEAHRLGRGAQAVTHRACGGAERLMARVRSEEHTSELQSLTNLVCRLLLAK